VLHVWINGLASGVIAIGIAYYGVGLFAGWCQLRRRGTTLATQAATFRFGHPHSPAPPDGWFTYFLVPALNEALVIGRTTRWLTGGDGKSHVVVIDDGSDDGTGPLAASAGSGVTVVRRELPNARKGKGAALNTGYAWLLGDAERRGLDPDRVIVCVIDADGRLSDGALAQVIPCFRNPKVGAVQLAVRIRNRTTFLTQFQDFCFWSLAAVFQFGRMYTQSVSLGGNGQFSRLSALSQMGDEPWSDSLTEDLDLGVRLAIAGWQSTSATGAAVDQQAVPRLRQYVNQRTRWYQGHMTAGKHIPAIWGSAELPNYRALELAGYLLAPWVLDLPWSVLFHVCLFGMIMSRADIFTPGSEVLGVPLALTLWYLIAFFPSLLTGLLYFRRDPKVGFLPAMLYGHSFVVMNYVAFACVWRAAYRMLRGRTSWAKTEREAEVLPAGAPEFVVLSPVDYVPGAVATSGRAYRPASLPPTEDDWELAVARYAPPRVRVPERKTPDNLVQPGGGPVRRNHPAAVRRSRAVAGQRRDDRSRSHVNGGAPLQTSHRLVTAGVASTPAAQPQRLEER
jgi:glycosyltransferase involved in cell wall biosynthesis